MPYQRRSRRVAGSVWLIRIRLRHVTACIVTITGPLPRQWPIYPCSCVTFIPGRRSELTLGVIDFLAAVMDAVDAQNATILSAYRTSETNAMLQRTTFGVAENSQHLYGRALDIRIGARLAEAMLAARAMQRGGVGWYPNSGFLHINTGPVRNWDLDENGLGSLLFDGERFRFDGKERSVTRLSSGRFLPEMERSGGLLPVLERSGSALPGMEHSGRLLPDMARGHRPL